IIFQSASRNDTSRCHDVCGGPTTRLRMGGSRRPRSIGIDWRLAERKMNARNPQSSAGIQAIRTPYGHVTLASVRLTTEPRVQHGRRLPAEPVSAAEVGAYPAGSGCRDVSRRMRLVTWNCCRGRFERKVPLLAPLAFDVAVVQECSIPSQPDASTLWFGDNPTQGVAVVATPEYELAPLATDLELPRYVIPVQVSGPVSFLLLAVWTHREPTYVDPLLRAIGLFGDQ